MTENRYIEVLKKMKHMFTETCAKIDENTALDMAVEAIKEIQQYRAIGTVEDVAFYKKCYDEESYEFCGEYGTDNCGCKDRMEYLEKKVAEFETIGTIEEFKALKEKNEPKKPSQVSKAMDKDKFVGLIGRCPNCGSIVAEDMFVCENCFQVLDWNE